MRVILFFATLAPLFMAGQAGFLKGLFFCGRKCNPHPEEPLRHCLHKCGWKVGSYYDGSECWILGGLGNHFKWRGVCKKGFCVRSSKGYGGSEAEKHCGPKPTAGGNVVTTTTATAPNGIPGTSPHAAESEHKGVKPSSSIPVTLPSATTNASASTNATSHTNPSSMTQVQNVTNTAEKTTAANDVTQASSDPNSSPTTQHQSGTTATGATTAASVRTPAPSSAISSWTSLVENATTTTEDQPNASLTTAVILLNETSSRTLPKKDTPTEDTTKANVSIDEISTASTLLITEVRGEPTTENITPGTRTYGPRPEWLNERFRTATTTKATPGTNANNEVVVSSTSEATLAHSSHRVSTRGTETSDPIKTQETTVSATKVTVGNNSSDDATGTTAVSSTSQMTC